MKRLLTWLSRKRFPYEPLIVMNISRSRLLHNLNQFRSIAPNHSVAPVIKGNAYGHGLVEVARIFEKEKNIPFLVIDSYFEAVKLRASGINTKLLIVGYTRPETIIHSRLKNVSFTITSIETLRALNKAGHCTIHIKIDTGMHRQGILPEEISEAIGLIRNNPRLILHGIASHLCDADNIDKTFTNNQIILWNKIVEQFRQSFPAITYIHISATHGHRFSSDISANISRLGIGLYGLEDGNLFDPPLDLQPALNMQTIITSVKNIKNGDTVGYGKTFRATTDMLIATIPVGYYEGMDQRLSNKGFVLVGPDRIPCAIIGAVSMNISTIDVSSVPDAKIGMNVIAVSDNLKDQNCISSMAKLCKTNTYGIAARFPAHLKRVIVA